MSSQWMIDSTDVPESISSRMKEVSDLVQAEKAAMVTLLKDENIPFAVRRAIWFYTPEELLVQHDRIFHPKKYEETYDDISWYDIGYQRMEVIDLRNHIENIEDEEEANMFILDCLEAGIHTFVYDW